MGATGEIVVSFCCCRVRFWGPEYESFAFSQNAELEGQFCHSCSQFRTQNHAARAVMPFYGYVIIIGHP